jgi:8-oxo-dGTP diphosphatase
MKKYAVVLLITHDFKKILLVKMIKNPFVNCWNGIGGKIEDGETVIEASIRECKEETGIDLVDPKLLVTYIYPPSSAYHSEVNIVYSFCDEASVEENEEGVYEWKDIDFVMNFDSKDIAGYSILGQFIKEIFDVEGIKKFYD